MAPPEGRRVEVVEERPRRRWGGLIATVLVLLLLAGVALAIVLINSSSDDAKGDVTVSRCESTGGGNPEASGQIRNGTSKTSNYVIRIDFNDDSGNTVSEGAVTVKSVEANDTAEWQLTGARDASGKLECEINRVSRTHLPGQ
jgi:hypothetical protein